MRRRCCTPRPQTWQARTAGRQRPKVAPARAGSRVLGGVPATRRAYRREDDSRIAGGGRQNAPPRSGETGGEGCRLSGRRGRHARGRPVLGSRRRRMGHSPPRPSAGEQTARAQARAPTRATSLAAACMRATRMHVGRMRATCAGRMQTCEQTGRWDGTGHVDNGTSSAVLSTCVFYTVKAWKRPPVVMPSASLV